MIASRQVDEAVSMIWQEWAEKKVDDRTDDTTLDLKKLTAEQVCAHAHT